MKRYLVIFTLFLPCLVALAAGLLWFRSSHGVGEAYTASWADSADENSYIFTLHSFEGRLTFAYFHWSRVPGVTVPSGFESGVQRRAVVETDIDLDPSDPTEHFIFIHHLGDFGWYARSMTGADPDPLFGGGHWIYRGIFCPAWFVTLSFFALALAGMRRDLRPKRGIGTGQCARCQYDLRIHVPSQRCPECGLLIPLPEWRGLAPHATSREGPVIKA